MRVLVTGSSGWLGQTLVPHLRAAGHAVLGIDREPAPTTALVGSAADRAFVREAVARHEAEGIIHAAALHKPHVALRSNAEFVETNVTGTLNLLEEAVAQRVRSFVFTSTTSLMISGEIRAGKAGGATRAAWITEEMAPLLPRNIYGVTKLAAEHLCRLFHELHGLPVVVLRTGRFFPEEDDMAHAIAQSGENTKVNELLFRRLTVADAAACHALALEKAPAIGFDTFIVAAPTPFVPADCQDLIGHAPAVVERLFPDYPAIYRRLGWTMFDTIDRVYDAGKAARELGFVCRTGFRQALDRLAANGSANLTL